MPGLTVRRNAGERVVIYDEKGSKIGEIVCISPSLAMNMVFDKKFKILREEFTPERTSHVQR